MSKNQKELSKHLRSTLARLQKEPETIRNLFQTQSTKTIADGIAINTPISEPYQLLKTIVDDMILIDDEQIVQAMKLFFDHEHIATEPAGSISLAVAIDQAEKHKEKTVGIIISGSNVNSQYREKWLHGLM